MACRLHRIAAHGLRVLGAVGQARGVAEIEEVFLGQARAQGFKDGQAAHAGIEYANREFSLQHINKKTLKASRAKAGRVAGGEPPERTLQYVRTASRTATQSCRAQQLLGSFLTKLTPQYLTYIRLR